MMTYVLWTLLGINILATIVTVYDKLIAGTGKRRVPEQTLFLLALIGGAPMMYLTMLLIRHKTLHKRFMLGLPLILLLQVFLFWIKK